MISQLRDPKCRSRVHGQEARVRAWPIAAMTAQGVDGFGAQERHAAAVRRLSASGMKRLDPDVLGLHLAHMLRAARALCGSRESAEDLVQETVARVLSRPRLLRGKDERAYLMQALRNTFVSSRRTAARRPHIAATLEELETADRSTAAAPEEAVIAAQVFPAIARLPESLRLTLLAVDVAGLSYSEAARALGAPEATVTTRLYRARQRVARELDPERFGDQYRSGTGGRRPATDRHGIVE
jgi:RNA polymerase sigma-70 factor (ECF subfamily)